MPAPGELQRALVRRCLRLAQRFDTTPLLKALLAVPTEAAGNPDHRRRESVSRPPGYLEDPLPDRLVREFAGGPCYLPTPPASLADFALDKLRRGAKATSGGDLFDCLRRLNAVANVHARYVKEDQPLSSPALHATLVDLPRHMEQSVVLAAHPMSLHHQFRQAVVWILPNYEPDRGLIGLILNKPLKPSQARRLRANLASIGSSKVLRRIPMHDGGPVDKFVVLLHPYPGLFEGLDPINMQWDIGGEWSLQIMTDRVMKFLPSVEQQLDPALCRFFLGMSIWHEPGQLEAELRDRLWIPLWVHPMSVNTLYRGEDLARMWPRVVGALGDEFTDLARMPLLSDDEAAALLRALRLPHQS